MNSLQETQIEGRANVMVVSPKFRFQTIVAAADFSDSLCAAEKYAQAIAKAHGAKLIIAHIIDPVGFAYPSRYGRPCVRAQRPGSDLAAVLCAMAVPASPGTAKCSTGTVWDSLKGTRKRSRSRLRRPSWLPAAPVT
jgi:hypothetical protein